jgi:hypothetical protein
MKVRLIHPSGGLMRSVVKPARLTYGRSIMQPNSHYDSPGTQMNRSSGMERNSITLLQYAGFLLVVGLASAFYSAADRTVGWNPHGVSGLAACGGAAVIIGVLGVLVAKGQPWAQWAGVALAFLLLSFGGMQVFKIGRDIEKPAAEMAVKRGITQEAAERAMIYRVGIFGAMTLFSLQAFMRVGLALRREPAA